MATPKKFTLRRCIRAHYLGEISIRQFCDATRLEWGAMAAKLLRRWKAPASVDVEDLTQELLVGALRAFRKYDPAKSEVEMYVLWTAVDKAKKWLHRQRGVVLSGDPGKRPSNLALSIQAMAENKGDEGGPAGEDFLSFLSAEAAQDWRLEEEEIYARARETAEGRSPEETAAMREVVGLLAETRKPTLPPAWRKIVLRVHPDRRARVGLGWLVAQVIYQDRAMRYRFQLGSQRQANTLVSKAMRHLAEQVSEVA